MFVDFFAYRYVRGKDISSVNQLNTGCSSYDAVESKFNKRKRFYLQHRL